MKNDNSYKAAKLKQKNAKRLTNSQKKFEVKKLIFLNLF